MDDAATTLVTLVTTEGEKHCGSRPAQSRPQEALHLYFEGSPARDRWTHFQRDAGVMRGAPAKKVTPLSPGISSSSGCGTQNANGRCPPRTKSRDLARWAAAIRREEGMHRFIFKIQYCHRVKIRT